MNLRVVSTELTRDPTLCVSPEGMGALSPEAGWKLIRVTLRGKATRSGEVILPDSGFVAIYEEPGKKVRTAAVAAAMCVNRGILAASYPDKFQQYSLTAGPVSITVIFSVPEQVNRFQITYPAIVEGVASVPEKNTKLR
ncbi:MAG TPA: hypothetical protein VH601_14015 [Bryobacteraceae bacterium]